MFTYGFGCDLRLHLRKCQGSDLCYEERSRCFWDGRDWDWFVGRNHETWSTYIHGVACAAAILMWRGVGQKDDSLVNSSVFVYVCGSPAGACSCIELLTVALMAVT